MHSTLQNADLRQCLSIGSSANEQLISGADRLFCPAPLAGFLLGLVIEFFVSTLRLASLLPELVRPPDNINFFGVSAMLPLFRCLEAGGAQPLVHVRPNSATRPFFPSAVFLDCQAEGLRPVP